jgi:hypothetical protein
MGRAAVDGLELNQLRQMTFKGHRTTAALVCFIASAMGRGKAKQQLTHFASFVPPSRGYGKAIRVSILEQAAKVAALIEAAAESVRQK